MEDEILIDNYLKGELSKDEEKAFLERLESDIAFNEKFQLEKQLFDALNEDSWSFTKKRNKELEKYKTLLESEDIKALKDTLKSTTASFNTSDQNNKSRRIYYYLAAASVVVFLGFQFFFNQNVSNQDLYNDYVGLSDLPSFVSRNDEANTLSEAQNLFEAKKYDEALTIFQSQPDDVENKSNVLIYQGIAQTKLGRYKEAEDTFNSLINSDLLDANKGYWYKALLYLKQSRVEDTKEILNRIVSENLFNKKKAQDLLSELQ